VVGEFLSPSEKTIFPTYHQFLVGKPEGKKGLGKPRNRRVNNKMDLSEIG
jgi:hypothetical protein